MSTLSFAVLAMGLIANVAAAPFRLAQRQDSCAAAFDMCIFTFEGANGIPSYPVGRPGVSISSPIVYKEDVVSFDDGDLPMESPGGGVSPFAGAVVGSVDATAEAYVVTDDGLVLISDYQCPTQSFSSSFIKAANLGSSSNRRPISGASHEALQGDQADCLDGLCVVMTMQKWQSFTDNGVLNIVSPPSQFLTNCAVFRLEI